MAHDNVGVPAGSGLGGRIRAARTRRGLFREAVAALCGRSEEWLRQIERGKRGTGLKMVTQLAEILKVQDLTELLGEYVPTAVYARPEHPALDRIRRAVATHHAAEDAPDLVELRQRIGQAWRLRSVSSRDRSDLAALLPSLLIGAQQAARAAATATERRDAHELLAEVYHLGQLYLCYQDAPELLWVVVDRAMSAALASEDAATIARAAWFSAYLYRDFGEVDLAHQVVDDARRQLDAAGYESPALLRQRCVVHLAAAWNHARDGQPAQAWREWDAAVATESDSGQAPSPYALFGATCEDVALSLDVELGKTVSALRRAESTDADLIRSIPRRARVMIEAARGYALKREHAGVLHLLQQAHQTSPEATLYSMYARGMVHDLLTHSGPMLRSGVVDLAGKLGVNA